MKIITRSFGEIRFQEEEVIRLTDGLLGFSNLKEYIVLESADEDLFVWFQSLENPEIAFPLLEPEIYTNDYSFTLSDWDKRKLEIADRKDLRIFNIVTIPEDVSLMTANMKAPLIVNKLNRTAKQIILQEPRYQIKTPIFSELQARLALPNVQSLISRRAQKEEGLGNILIPARQDVGVELDA